MVDSTGGCITNALRQLWSGWKQPSRMNGGRVEGSYGWLYHTAVGAISGRQLAVKQVMTRRSYKEPGFSFSRQKVADTNNPHGK